MSKCIWLTGLSGSGKTTIANLLAAQYKDQGQLTCVLDGDQIRLGLNKDLGFTKSERHENARRVAEVAKILVDLKILVIVALISPFSDDRHKARALFIPGQFIEVFIDTSLNSCINRDVKGLYTRQKKGLVKNMTGISSPYEIPINPDIHLRTDTTDAIGCCEIIKKYINI